MRGKGTVESYRHEEGLGLNRGNRCSFLVGTQQTIRTPLPGRGQEERREGSKRGGEPFNGEHEILSCSDPMEELRRGRNGVKTAVEIFHSKKNLTENLVIKLGEEGIGPRNRFVQSLRSKLPALTYNELGSQRAPEKPAEERNGEEGGVADEEPGPRASRKSEREDEGLEEGGLVQPGIDNGALGGRRGGRRG